MKTRIHISLEVSDLKKSIHFYENLFSHKVSKVKSDYANFRMDEPGLHLALVERAREKEIGFGHLNSRHYGVELFSNDVLDQWKQRVNEAGVETRTQTNVTCCYAKANKFWARDPDGHEWEFWVKLDEASQLNENALDDNQKEQCCVAQDACC